MAVPTRRLGSRSARSRPTIVAALVFTAMLVTLWMSQRSTTAVSVTAPHTAKPPVSRRPIVKPPGMATARGRPAVVVEESTEAPEPSDDETQGNAVMEKPVTAMMSNGGHSGGYGSAVASYHVHFNMHGTFATAWRKSSERVSFETTMSFIAKDSHGAVVPFYSSAKDKPVRVRITFYGKSSLKIKYTKRRSIQVDVVDSDPSAGPRWPGTALDAQAPLRRFLLLSLWEDTFRVAYRSSSIVLRELGLFFAENRLVGLGCGGPGDGDAVCGASLGAYLLIEYPSDAIARVMDAKNGIAPALSECRSSLHGEGVIDDALEKAGVGRPDLYEKAGAERVEIATRNWFYFEKPANYDLLHVPSYKRNSTLSSTYRQIERDPVRGASVKGVSGASVFDVDKYLAWVAVNTLLQNGDYDDEVFFYRAGGYVGVMAWDYDSVFSACHRHGKQAIRTNLMFCAETPLEKLILDKPQLRDAYFHVASCVMGRAAAPEAWDAATGTALKELQAVFKADSDAKAATFQEGGKAAPDVVAGVKSLQESFRKRWQQLASALPPGSVKHESSPNKAAPADDGDAAASPPPPPPTVQHSRIPSPQQDLTPAAGLSIKGTCKANAAAGLAASLRNWVKKEYKGTATFLESGPTLVNNAAGLSAKDVAYGIAGPNGPVSLGQPVADAGMYCAHVNTRSGSCVAQKTAVIRSKERGKAEFAVPHFTPKSLTTLAQQDTDVRSQLHRVTLSTPVGLWPAGIPVPVVVRLIGHDDVRNVDGWLRANAVASVRASKALQVAGKAPASADDGDDEDAVDDNKQDLQSSLGKKVAIVRGFSAFLVAQAADMKLVDAVSGGGGAAELKTGVQVPRSTRSVKVSVGSASATADVMALRSGLDAPEGGEVTLDKEIEGSLEFPTEAQKQAGACLVRAGRAGSTVAVGASVTIGPGCTVVLPKAAALQVLGSLVVKGTAQKPVSIVPTSATTLFDTILAPQASSKVELTHVFITGSGGGTARADVTGHHHTASAAITAMGGAVVTVKHSYFVRLPKSSAIAAGTGAKVTVDHSVVQFAAQGAECVLCDFAATGTVWSHFANDFGASYEDDDNDALYLSGGHHRLLRNVIANTHDDGIDTGTPDEKTPAGRALKDGGSLHIDESIIETAFHEGIALSGAPKASRIVSITNSVVRNVQQGIEVGYSGEGHKAAVSKVLLEQCAIGLRYGDNYYNRGVSGHIRVTDSVIRGNTYAFLNYVRQAAAPKPAGYVELASTTIADRQAPPADQWPCQDIFTTRTDVKRGEGMEETTAEGILKHVESIVVLPSSAAA